jgi:ring-1,2-phenylacetyl-CoA epoxidase subunit PaaD
MELQTDHINQLLGQIPDPEIPVISIVELGVVRGVRMEGDKVIVTITPTYSGCPAMRTIEMDIFNKLKDAGFGDIEIRTVQSPAWTTDWMADEAKEKLRAYGIAPPNEHLNQRVRSILSDEVTHVQCPHCASWNTHLTSQFGSTACKALYKCDDCLEPFDYFKCI